MTAYRVKCVLGKIALTIVFVGLMIVMLVAMWVILLDTNNTEGKNLATGLAQFVSIIAVGSIPIFIWEIWKVKGKENEH